MSGQQPKLLYQASCVSGRDGILPMKSTSCWGQWIIKIISKHHHHFKVEKLKLEWAGIISHRLRILCQYCVQLLGNSLEPPLSCVILHLISPNYHDDRSQRVQRDVIIPLHKTSSSIQMCLCGGQRARARWQILRVISSDCSALPKTLI